MVKPISISCITVEAHSAFKEAYLNSRLKNTIKAKISSLQYYPQKRDEILQIHEKLKNLRKIGAVYTHSFEYNELMHDPFREEDLVISANFVATIARGSSKQNFAIRYERIYVSSEEMRHSDYSKGYLPRDYEPRLILQDLQGLIHSLSNHWPIIPRFDCRL
ncbi:hypothetical protein BCV72DRAFT_313463 [Rhizopus microsporus var. microsporus]|uniref:Uncharacterized protein n=2 Tax=Rhizopus microsporus TaxID=58291 RepID=A0A2G4SWI2_RHIZD|nr:uncharacterized protein RHIMIDRAFT_237129 [Rhizopus microsporus ATCC 52813]ORE04160.1 hypothetical protein BCV72DRAFT_313463 [Rhizopus microsporus var. microsporus]PHZ13102.1 hypothetical protein RHIMIDRAFT_237129 [Rhizopus microsporus ATCC 52813]